MQRKLLDKKISFQLSLSVWQWLLLAEAALLIVYACWEIYWYTKVGAAAIKWHTYFALGALSFSLLFLLPFKQVSSIRQRSWLFASYAGLSLLIGEIHPFTTVPMYTTFPNYAYSFKLTDTKGNLIPIAKYYHSSSDELSHQFSNIANNLHLSSTDYEDSYNMRIIGKMLFTGMRMNVKNTPPVDSIQLYLVSYTRNNGNITAKETLMYADGVRH